jgi:hypothetical protein
MELALRIRILQVAPHQLPDDSRKLLHLTPSRLQPLNLQDFGVISFHLTSSVLRDIRQITDKQRNLYFQIYYTVLL